MNMRGLQIIALVGITALGAASSHAWTYNGLTYPDNMLVQGSPYGYMNGLWLAQTNVNNGGWWFVQYGATNVLHRVHLTDNGTSTSVWLMQNGNNRVDLTPQVNTSQWRSAGFPTQTFQAGGTVAFNISQDPYDQAFPDWESAAVKIPLGFTFAMSFWAAAVALSIGMKWVRDLASAAS
jgi:hypothetical protein